MTKKLRVAVIYGGRSGEHEVSLQSAASVMEAMDREKYEVVPVKISKDGQWLLQGPSGAGNLSAGEIPGALLADPTRQGLVALDQQGVVTAPGNTGPGQVATPVNTGPLPGSLARVDVVFPVLHGPYGEDGAIQGLLELANLPYVGGGVAASAVGMDKGLMKAAFAYKGLPQAKFLTVLRNEWETDPKKIKQTVAVELGYPCFIKPANLGSSVGISKARTPEELVPAMYLAGKFDRKIIIEEFVNAREIEVAVLGNDDPRASVPGEIRPCNEFYDYKAKYIDGTSELMIPADIPPETAAEARRLAVEAFKAIDCAGLARVDFFLTKETGKLLLNEINTIPGFTKFSMYPKLWEATGIPYARLIDELIDLALERHRDKNRNVTSYK
ncbi:MAG: D-alanine--D-alanine ligase family protein [Bacillota bacterium]